MGSMPEGKGDKYPPEELSTAMKELGIYTGVNIALSWVLSEIYAKWDQGEEISIRELVRKIKKQKRVYAELRTYAEDVIRWKQIARKK